jgi:hypothetical protein
MRRDAQRSGITKVTKAINNMLNFEWNLWWRQRLRPEHVPKTAASGPALRVSGWATVLSLRHTGVRLLSLLEHTYYHVVLRTVKK